MDQWSLQFIDKVLINCKKIWYNKAGTENRTFFEHAHNCDSRVMRMHMTLSGYGTSFIYQKTSSFSSFYLDLKVVLICTTVTYCALTTGIEFLIISRSLCQQMFELYLVQLSNKHRTQEVTIILACIKTDSIKIKVDI